MTHNLATFHTVAVDERGTDTGLDYNILLLSHIHLSLLGQMENSDSSFDITKHSSS